MPGMTPQERDALPCMAAGCPRPRVPRLARCRPHLNVAKYGLSDEQYEKLYANEWCQICGAAESSRGRALSIDHDHQCCPGEGSCGKCVRGLLCLACNMGIGNLGDDLKLLRRAIDYLDFFGAKNFRGSGND